MTTVFAKLSKFLLLSKDSCTNQLVPFLTLFLLGRFCMSVLGINRFFKTSILPFHLKYWNWSIPCKIQIAKRIFTARLGTWHISCTPNHCHIIGSGSVNFNVIEIWLTWFWWLQALVIWCLLLIIRSLALLVQILWVSRKVAWKNPYAHDGENSQKSGFGRIFLEGCQIWTKGSGDLIFLLQIVGKFV
jgi:hypothetical protein